jgi:processive 1,2-diacylglycerol beta-glucosyltransferase
VSGPRILILSASIGEGHDLPARVLARGIAEEDPVAEVEIADSLAMVSDTVRNVLIGGSQFHSAWGNRMFDLEFRLITAVRPTRWLARTVLVRPAARRIAPHLDAARAGVIVSTYPGATEVLGMLRARGRLNVPVVSAITDLAALRYWAHPAVDLHLITHPESAEEVRSIAPASEIVCVRGLTDASFYEPRDPASARAALGLPADGPIVVVSGGGWAVGDLAGAADAALADPAVTVVCLCGRKADVQAEFARRFAYSERVVVWGFTDRMSDLLAAADVLVHSTAGLTVLEAIMRGCRVVSYGWNRAHVRVNNEAFERFGLAEVATSKSDLEVKLRAALAHPRRPDRSFESLPSAASLVLALAARARTASPRSQVDALLRDDAGDCAGAAHERDPAHERDQRGA